MKLHDKKVKAWLKKYGGLSPETEQKINRDHKGRFLDKYWRCQDFTSRTKRMPMIKRSICRLERHSLR